MRARGQIVCWDGTALNRESRKKPANALPPRAEDRSAYVSFTVRLATSATQGGRRLIIYGY